MAVSYILERKETLLKLNDMTNEEKALEIQHNDPCCVWNEGCPNVRNGAMKMARWKDEQFSNFLLQLDDNCIIKKPDGEPVIYSDLIDNFKLVEQQ